MPSDIRDYFPDLGIRRGGIRFLKCVLKANSFPVAVQNSHGLMLRFSSSFGYEGSFTCYHLDVHDEDNLLAVRAKGDVRGNGDSYTVELLHVESRHDKIGSVATISQAAPAQRRTIKARTRSGLGTFRLELFRPETV